MTTRLTNDLADVDTANIPEREVRSLQTTEGTENTEELMKKCGFGASLPCDSEVSELAKPVAACVARVI